MLETPSEIKLSKALEGVPGFARIPGLVCSADPIDCSERLSTGGAAELEPGRVN